LVVDDGSSDGTKKCALAHGCYVSRSPVNRGQGAASRIGYAFLAKHHVRYGVTMDADNQHRPEDLEKLIEPLLAQKYDLVIGSRVLGSAEKDSLTRSLGVSVFSWVLATVAGVRLTDCSSGFKAFDMQKMAALDLREDQFQSSEVLIAAARSGMRIGEVPIHIQRRGSGQSKKGTNLSYGFRFFRTMARSWWR
jgi:glycosyltransferase involved in cell wall biosynthesis